MPPPLKVNVLKELAKKPIKILGEEGLVYVNKKLIQDLTKFWHNMMSGGDTVPALFSKVCKQLRV